MEKFPIIKIILILQSQKIELMAQKLSLCYLCIVDFLLYGDLDFTDQIDSILRLITPENTFSARILLAFKNRTVLGLILGLLYKGKVFIVIIIIITKHYTKE